MRVHAVLRVPAPPGPLPTAPGLHVRKEDGHLVAETATATPKEALLALDPWLAGLARGP